MASAKSDEEYYWRFLTFTAEGSKVKKVGLSLSMFGDDGEWFTVHHVQRDTKDPQSICIKFTHPETNKERVLSGKKKELTLPLDSYMAASKSVWTKLENTKDAQLFIQRYIQIQQSETKEDSDSEDSDRYQFVGTPVKKKKKTTPRKQSMLQSTPNKDKDTQPGSEDDLFGTPTPSPDKSKKSFESEESDVNVIFPTPTKPVKDPKSKHKRKPPFTSVSSDDEEEKSVKPKRKRKKTSTVSCSNSKDDFRTEVRLLREKHPDLGKVGEDVALTKTGPWRRNEATAITGLDADGINRSKGVHLTVATLSERCYKLAEGIMDKWESGKYKRQSSTEVKQTIFQHLNGLADERDNFNVLQRFHDGDIESKIEFDIAIKKIKATRKEGTSSCSCQEMETQKAQLQQDVDSMEQQKATLQQQKATLEQDVKEMKRKQKEIKKTLDDMAVEKHQLQVDLNEMRRKKQSIQSDLEKMETEKKLQEEEGKGTLEKAVEDQKQVSSKSKQAASEPGTKRKKTLTTWDNSAIEEGQEVGVIYTLPKEQLFYGTVETVNLKEQKVNVAFFKTTKKSMTTCVAERAWVDPIYIVDNHVQLSKDGSTLSLSKAEETRIKEKTKKYWNAAD